MHNSQCEFSGKLYFCEELKREEKSVYISSDKLFTAEQKTQN